MGTRRAVREAVSTPSAPAAIGPYSQAISAGGVRRADGSAQAEPVREALVTRDRKRVYRVDDGIPVLLAEEAIDTDQLAGFAAA